MSFDPELLKTLMAITRGDWFRQKNRMSQLLGSTTADMTARLGGALSENLGRMGVSIPAGTQSLATKYMAPVVGQMQGVYDFLLQKPSTMDMLSQVLSASDLLGSRSINLTGLQEILGRQGRSPWWQGSTNYPSVNYRRW